MYNQWHYLPFIRIYFILGITLIRVIINPDSPITGSNHNIYLVVKKRKLKKMETLQTDKICRACLREDEKMIDMSGNLTVEKDIPDVSLNLCQSCEQKLNIPLDFREVISSRKGDDSEATATADVDTPEATDVNAKKLVQFPQNQVLEAIKDLKQNLYEKKQCIRCRFVGSQSTALSIHISLMHKDLKPRWCCVCNVEFDNLTDHVATNHNDDHTCKFCRKKFQTITYLIDHLRRHSGIRLFRCPFCKKSYKRQSRLNAHVNDHTKEKLHKCGSCDSSFTQVNQLKNHLKMHTSEGDADKQLAAFKLKKHKRVHTRKALHKCTYCDKKLKSHYHLVMHERTHTGEKPYVCQVCGKSFTQSDALKTHMIRLHNIGLTISCKICDKKFCYPSELRRHVQCHTGEKPFVCSECGKGFIQSSHLVQHNKTHNNLRPYQCSHCNKSFKQKSTFEQHVWIHSGKKPYKCNQCSYACRRSDNLTLHMKKHVLDKPQADRPHVCLMCNKTFTTDANLTSHINRHNVSFLEI